MEEPSPVATETDVEVPSAVLPECTLFVKKGDAACSEAVAVFHAAHVPTRLLDVDLFPQRYVAAVAHSGCQVVLPLVFVGARCVGSLCDVRQLIERITDIKTALTEFAAHERSSDVPPFLSDLSEEEKTFVKSHHHDSVNTLPAATSSSPPPPPSQASLRRDATPMTQPQFSNTTAMSPPSQTALHQHYHQHEFDFATPSPVRKARFLERTFPIPRQPDGARMSYTELFGILHGAQGVTIKDRGFLWRHKRTFLASELVATLLLRVCGRGAHINDAVPLCRELFRRHMIAPVDPAVKEFEWSDTLWRFSADHGTPSLNSDRRFEPVDDAPPRNAAEVAAELCIWAQLLVNECRTSNGLVDYAALGRRESFLAFTLATTELQSVDLYDLSRVERISFCINVFNTGVIHAYATRGPPRTATGADHLFQTAGYDIGGQYFSLYEIRDGLLRCNRPTPGAWSPPFGKKDPRLDVVVWNPDYRAVFALCRQLTTTDDGAPDVVYSVQELDQQLQTAADTFVERNVTLVSEKRQLRLCKFFSDFASDFGSTVVPMCVKHLSPMAAAECIQLGGTDCLETVFFVTPFAVNSSRK